MFVVTQSRIVAEALLVIFFVYFVQKEVRQMLHAKAKLGYFADLTNVFEWFFLSTYLALFVTWLRFTLDPLRVCTDRNSSAVVLLSCCPVVLLSCCPVVLRCCCVLVLLCCCAVVPVVPVVCCLHRVCS